MIEFQEEQNLTESGGPDMTPMIDMVFLLLIFFLLTFSFTTVWGVNVNLPGMKEPEKRVESRVLRVAVASNGEIFMDSKPVGLQELEMRLQEKLAEREGAEEDSVLIVSADAGSMHGRVVEVMGAARAAGIRRLAIEAAEPPPAEGLEP